jgi:hypothetical protein
MARSHQPFGQIGGVVALIARDSGLRWPNGIIPFKFDPTVDMPLQTVIGQAQKAWEAKTPVRFVMQTTEPDFVLFRSESGADPCSSPVGRQGGSQELKCFNKSSPADTLKSLVHELGHTIGLWHEHQRLDRDALISVSKAKEEEEPENYKPYPDLTQMVGLYDFDSVMHYPWNQTNPPPATPPAVPLPITKLPTAFGPNVWPSPSAPSGGDALGVCFMYGIVQKQTPVAVLRRADWHMEVWMVGDDEVVRGAWFDGGWRTWYQLHGRSFPQRGWLAVLSRHDKHMELFGIGKDALLHRIHFDGGWQKWKTLGAPNINVLPNTPLMPGAPLAVRARTNNHEEVWVVANDFQVHHRWWDGSQWQDWHDLPLLNGSFLPGAPLAVHSRHENHVEIWGVAADAMLYHNWWDGNNWSGWNPLPTPVSGPGGFRLEPGGHLAVLGRSKNHMEVWSIGTDKKLHGIWWAGDGGGWQDWYTLGGPDTFKAGAPLVALSRGSNHMEVYCVTDANILRGIFFDGGWQTWHTIDPTPVPSESPLCGVSRGEQHLELWCVAPDGAAAAKDVGAQGVWWDGSIWRMFYRVI